MGSPGLPQGVPEERQWVQCREMRPTCPPAVLSSQPGLLLVRSLWLCLCRRHGALASRARHFLPSCSSHPRLLAPFITSQPGVGEHLLNESEGDPGKKRTSADRTPQSRGRSPMSVVDPSFARLVRGCWGSQPPRPHALMRPGAPVTVPARRAGVPALLKCEPSEGTEVRGPGFPSRWLLANRHSVQGR